MQIILVTGGRVQAAHGDRTVIAEGAVAIVDDELPRGVVVGAQSGATDRSRAGVVGGGKQEVET